MECFREFIQKSPRNVFILSTAFPIEFLIIYNQKNSENLNMLRFNWKPWVIGNWCFYLWINFGIQTSPFSWSESDILLDFQPCQGGSIQRNYPEEVSGGSIRRMYTDQWNSFDHVNELRWVCAKLCLNLPGQMKNQFLQKWKKIYLWQANAKNVQDHLMCD